MVAINETSLNGVQDNAWPTETEDSASAHYNEFREIEGSLLLDFYDWLNPEELDGVTRDYDTLLDFHNLFGYYYFQKWIEFNDLAQEETYEEVEEHSEEIQAMIDDLQTEVEFSSVMFKYDDLIEDHEGPMLFYITDYEHILRRRVVIELNAYLRENKNNHDSDYGEFDDRFHVQSRDIDSSYGDFSCEDPIDLDLFDITVQSNDIVASTDDFVSLVEDAAWCGYLLYRSPTKRGIAEAIFTFVKLRTKGSISINLYKSQLVSKFQEILGSDVEEFDIQSGDHLFVAKQLLGSYKELISSPIYKKLYRCIMYAISFDIFDKVGINMDSIGYGKMEKAILKRKFFSKGDFIYTLFDTVIFILEKGVHVYKTGDVESIIHSGSSYSDLHDKVSELKRKSRLVNNAEAHGFVESTFYRELDDTIEKMASIKKHARGMDIAEKAAISHRYD